ncbi:MAG: hypothetical protein KGI71_05665, partial [Patescibacteria group bacterium]|nr:hypothetical protein [Patescibacteria group bacterium]
MTDQVVLGWVHPGHVSGRFMDSVLRLMYQSGNDLVMGEKPYFTIAGHTHVESGPRIATARNEIVTRFLEKEEWKDVEWLLMVDSDMTFDGLLLNRLLKTARPEGPEGRVEQPVVGGLCFGGGHGMMFPTMYRIVDPAENEGNPVTIVT